MLQPSTADRSYDQGYPSFSPLLLEWLRQLAARLRRVATCPIAQWCYVTGVVDDPHRYPPASVARLLASINRELLRQQFDEWVKESAETLVIASDRDSEPQTLLPADASLLARFTVNVTTQTAKEFGSSLMPRSRDRPDDRYPLSSPQE